MKLKEEIKNKLQDICDRGFIETLRTGDTGIGFTLETLLGVEENNSSGADIDGLIELKAKRKEGSSRTTCFCLTPNWLSDIRSIIKKYGWDDPKKPERINFYTSLRYGAATPQGLSVDIDGNSLFILGREGEKLAELPLQKVEGRFREKFPELIIVSADSQKEKGAKEKFWFNEAYHCRDLNISRITEVLKAGKLILEARMWMHKETGKLRDRGFAFRMSSKDTKELFGNVERLV